jgi:acetyl esterase/lipase
MMNLLSGFFCLGAILRLTVLTTPCAFGAITEPNPANINFAGVEVTKDISYLGSPDREALDLYRPEKLVPGKAYPAVVIIHGGGWTEGSKSHLREQNFGTNLARAGYICASIDYALATKSHHTWPEVLYQCKSSIQFLRKNAGRYQIDPDHIGIMGGSAGGHLALMVGLTSVTERLQPSGPRADGSSRVEAVVDFYGPTNLPTALLDEYCVMLFGANKMQEPDLWEKASPVNVVTTHAPPVLVIHGTADQAVSLDQSEQLVRKLAREGVPHEFIRVNGAGHSFDFQPPQQDLRAAVIAFFDRYLKQVR